MESDRIQFEISVLPVPVERALEVAQRFGHFLLKTPEVHPYMSEHFRPEYPAEPVDGEAMQPQLPFAKEVRDGNTG